MRVFLELTHTSCDVAIMNSGFDFDVFHTGEWDSRGRPQPKNSRLVRALSGVYDAAIVGTDRGLSLIPAGTPVIWKCFLDFGQWPRPEEKILNRLSAWTAICTEAVSGWGMAGHNKAHVMEHGIDTRMLNGYSGGIARAMTVGNLVPRRPEKGPVVLQETAKQVPIDIFGVGNEKLSGVSLFDHAVNFEALAELYRSYRVYFNPAGGVCCALLEAMSTGMPVVTMRPGNFCDLMHHRDNCFIADSPDEAADFIKLCLSDKELSTSIGLRARASVVQRFDIDGCGRNWKRLIEQVIAARHR